MAKPNNIELPGEAPIPILFEDRAILAIDKPRGWMLVPFSWQKTNRNLQAALVSSIAAGDYWARSRNLKFLRYVHRLDTDTTGVMLFAKSQGAVDSYSELFESRQMEKTYLAVVAGVPKQDVWTCRARLGPDERRIGRQRVDEENGKPAETHFRVLTTIERDLPKPATPPRPSVSVTKHARTLRPPLVVTNHRTLIEARPLTGRTHQIRVHLTDSGFPIIGDDLYGRLERNMPMGLRAVRLAYMDPFTRRPIEIRAPAEKFCREYGFDWKEEDAKEAPRPRP